MDEDVDLDWDFVPLMLIFTASYLTVNTIAYLLFDAARELNRKVFNEIVKLCGTSNQEKIMTHSFLV